MPGKKFDAEKYTDELRARVGAKRADRIVECERKSWDELRRLGNYNDMRNQSDKAWTVMLVKQGVIPREIGAQILAAVLDIEDSGSDTSGEGPIAQRCGLDAAGFVNVGRTLGEPMHRLAVRDKLLPVFDWLLELRGVLIDGALEHAETVMPGYTHMCHAQATTYGHYLMSVHDPAERSMIELESAWDSTNRSSMGAGALAGTSWPVDRDLVSELLGMNGILENGNDCEGSRDHFVSVLAALSNLMDLSSRFSMEMNIWTTEEIRMIEVAPEYCGQSSMMPQKRNFGSVFERQRNDATRVFAMLSQVVTLGYSTPHGDMLQANATTAPTLEGIFTAERALGILAGIIPNLSANKDTMLKYAREGFACSSELAAELVRQRGVPLRPAHTTVATFVRIAWDADVTADKTTGEMLDEAAVETLGEPVGFTTEQVRQYLDPVHFVRVHTSVGGVASKMVRAAARKARRRLETAAKRHKERVKSISDAAKKLDREARRIIGK